MKVIVQFSSSTRGGLVTSDRRKRLRVRFIISVSEGFAHPEAEEEGLASTLLRDALTARPLRLNSLVTTCAVSTLLLLSRDGKGDGGGWSRVVRTAHAAVPASCDGGAGGATLSFSHTDANAVYTSSACSCASGAAVGMATADLSHFLRGVEMVFSGATFSGPVTFNVRLAAGSSVTFSNSTFFSTLGLAVSTPLLDSLGLGGAIVFDKVTAIAAPITVTASQFTGLFSIVGGSSIGKPIVWGSSSFVGTTFTVKGSAFAEGLVLPRNVSACSFVDIEANTLGGTSSISANAGARIAFKNNTVPSSATAVNFTLTVNSGPHTIELRDDHAATVGISCKDDTSNTDAPLIAAPTKISMSVNATTGFLEGVAVTFSGDTTLVNGVEFDLRLGDDSSLSVKDITNAVGGISVKAETPAPASARGGTGSAITLSAPHTLTFEIPHFAGVFGIADSNLANAIVWGSDSRFNASTLDFAATLSAKARRRATSPSPPAPTLLLWATRSAPPRPLLPLPVSALCSKATRPISTPTSPSPPTAARTAFSSWTATKARCV